MRSLTDRENIEKFMRELGLAAREHSKIYLTGGSTAVLLGWRPSTVDVDMKMVPELDEIFRAIPRLKESLGINIELASPPDFIPPVPGWEDRSIHIGRFGKIDFFHFDLYSQALSKIERGHAQDGPDVREMIDSGLVDPGKLKELFDAIESQLYRYPALDPVRFKYRVSEVVRLPG